MKESLFGAGSDVNERGLITAASASRLGKGQIRMVKSGVVCLASEHATHAQILHR
jgi:hypothetical protein